MFILVFLVSRQAPALLAISAGIGAVRSPSRPRGLGGGGRAERPR